MKPSLKFQSAAVLSRGREALAIGLAVAAATVSAQSVPATAAASARPVAVTQEVTVTATRSSLDLPATANTAYVLGAEALAGYPALALDDKLRQQGGFELFRRSSSRVQNPTSQGISLRGLGSTAASRTLVLEENVPLNDPFGGWIHWDEIPAEALESVTIATGGGSDLYGSSALGGVVDIVPARPTPRFFAANLLAGGQDTSSVGLRGDLAIRAGGSSLLGMPSAPLATFPPIPRWWRSRPPRKSAQPIRPQ